MGLAKMYELIGPAGVALILVAAAGLYLTIWTVIYLIRTGRGFRSTIHEAEADGISRERTEGNLNPLVCVVREVVFTHGSHSNDIRAEVAYLFHKHLAPVNNSMCWLKLIAAISPLLGLLGTVLGMVGVFQTIAVNQAPDPAALASGIWQALLTTVMGLVIAIPVLMVYYCLLLRIKGFRIEAVEHSYRALELVQGGRPTLEKEVKAQAETSRDAESAMFDDENEEPRIDLTSLIDVIFMLVIFFVMTMTFSSKPVLDIVLPESTQAKASEVPEELLVAVKADGSIWADGRPITPDGLASFIDSKPADAVLNLAVDKKAPFAAFVKVVDVAKEKKSGRFVIRTEDGGK